MSGSLLLTLLLPCQDGVWSDPALAAKEDPDFIIQGEYVGTLTDDTGEKKTIGVQVVALGKGRFMAVGFPGGLPGKGADCGARGIPLLKRKKGSTFSVNTDGYKKIVVEKGKMTAYNDEDKAVSTFTKVERKSPTLGAKPPKGAVVLFDGSGPGGFKGAKLDGKLLREGTQTTRTFRKFKLHLEFRLPYKPAAAPGGQGRGNSGVYLFNRYEVQILDSFGLHYGHFPKKEWRSAFLEECGFKPGSDRSQWGGCFYKFKMPSVNMSFPPLAWQTYDIEFTPPTFKDDKRDQPARITLLHNGVKIHDDLAMTEGGTGAGKGRGEVPEGPIVLQGHGNPVRFRNIWIVERE